MIWNGQTVTKLVSQAIITVVGVQSMICHGLCVAVCGGNDELE